ncbi:Lipase member K [Fragariocoptes setiger]|uniref:Lipase member K n=1 Tax=Fragariocoptes setiger TaxID=1670756 RepID=A0ABQ7SBE1_9ACAR|nr:Lipase member K [Fragariocoptes setiger]
MTSEDKPPTTKFENVASLMISCLGLLLIVTTVNLACASCQLNSTRVTEIADQLETLAPIDDPSLVAASPQSLLARAGFKYEVYNITTDDGYILQLIHIINPLVSRNNLRRLPVLMQCPLLVTSGIFLAPSLDETQPVAYPSNNQPLSDNPREWTSSNRSLALFLANNGFDMWLGCNRGCDANNMGLDETKASPRARANYYSYSIDDFARFDLSANVDGVLNKTGAKKLLQVGFSQGTLISFMRLATTDIANDTFSSKIHTFVAMAPVAGRMSLSPLQLPLRAVVAAIYPVLYPIFLNNPVLTPELSRLVITVTLSLYENLPGGEAIIQLIGSLLGGPSLNMQFDRVIVGQVPLNGHGNQLAHFAQLIMINQAAKFDYGPIENLQRYNNSLVTPKYDFTKIRLNQSIALFAGTNDALAPLDNVGYLRSVLQNNVFYQKTIEGYNHFDFSIARDNYQQVNKPILDLLIDRLAKVQ